MNEIEHKARAYLRIADRLLPGRIVGFYVVGSAALGEYQPGRSDLDFVALVRGAVTAGDVRRLRVLHLTADTQAAFETLLRRRPVSSGTPNGVFIAASDVGLPVSRIRPIASHVGRHFHVGNAFDANPVVWKVFAERGLTFRGEASQRLGLDLEPESLTAWNLANLEAYWEPWGVKEAARRAGFGRTRYRRAWLVAWGVLGAPRLHCTIKTGEVIGKRGAGEYALRTFGPEWRPIVELALAHWRGETVRATPDDVRRAGQFVLEVVADARR